MMSSPAKRRKKNDHDLPKRNLDFFFSRQNVRDVKRPETPELREQPSEAQLEVVDASQPLTDEELARKLQEQWNKEAGDGVAQDEAERTTENQQQAQEIETEKHSSNNEDSTVTPPPTSQAPQTPRTQKTLALQSATSVEDTVSADIPFDESPLTFDPSLYVPKLRGVWESEGGNATYALLTRCFVLVNSTQSRIKIVDTLVNLLRTIIVGDSKSLLPAVWLATNSISPPYIDLELGIGGSVISKALKKVCGLDNNSLKSLYNKYGDAGDVAFEAKKRQTFTLRKPRPLTIRGVFESLVKVANSKGTGSQEMKQRIVERLVQDARGAEESRYIVRTLVQHIFNISDAEQLRIGAVKTTMLIALSRAFLLSKPHGAEYETRDIHQLRSLKKEELALVYSQAEELVKASFARRPNYNDLVPTLLSIGVSQELIIRCGLSLHIPLRPMLGSITRDLQEMLVKLQGRDFACEFKYDGQRGQVHCDANGKVTIFSRHLEVMTEKYPDLVALVPKIRGDGVRSFIMEGEVVAIDRETGGLKTFQTLSNRARKDVIIGSVKIDVCLFAFDLMYLNGEELLDRPFRERRELLRSLFQEIPHTFTWVRSMDATSADSEAVLEFFKTALEYKCEGIMVKVLDNLPNPALKDEAAAADEAPTAPSPAPETPRKRKSTAAKPKNGDAAAEPDRPAAGARRKALLATYEPDKRLDSWLKVKKDYDSAAADTLDLVPVAGWHGQGRKSRWWSPILLAVRDPESGGLQAVTKCISGFTDKFYAENRARYDPDAAAGRIDEDEEGNEGDDEGDAGRGNNTLAAQPAYVEYAAGRPDVWFAPQEVWEVAFADITLSPTYTAAAGLVAGGRGLSLRFPRFLRARPDKGVEEASDADFLAGLWRKQEAKGRMEAAVGGGGGAGEEEGEDED